MFKKAFIILSLFISAVSLAAVPVDPMVAECKKYPEIKNSSTMPLKFKTTNNLAMADESGFYQAEGEKITIYGRVMDSACVPLSDAKIYIWQVNKAGYVQYESKGLPKPKWVDPNFDGTGIVNSDNMGRFNFTTIMPGSYHKYTPHINIKIEHPSLKTLYSKIYFPREMGDKIRDSVYISNSKTAAQVSAVPSEDQVNTYYIDVTMHQVLPYKEY